MDNLTESFSYILPSIVVGLIAYYFLGSLVNQNKTDRNLDLLIAKKKQSLPIRLQAHERMLLFCERINPVKMLLRIEPISEETNHYLQLLLKNIEQEFEHNLVQQIYLSDQCWNVIVASKNAITNKLKQVGETATSANELRENILIDYSKTLPPTNTAIDFIKNDVKKLL